MRTGLWGLLALVACSGGDNDDDGTDDSDGLSVEAFDELFADAACDAQIACNADPDIIDATCEPSTTATEGDFEDCDFDPDYAADCLEQEWPCKSIYGVTFAEVPSVCLLALDCDVDVIIDTGVTGDDDDDDDDTPEISDAFDDVSLRQGIFCSGDTVDIALDFLGDAAWGMLDSSDTANASSFNDFHTLDAMGTSGGGYTLLTATLETGVSLNDWSDGRATVFNCESHFGNPSVMTYAARAYDVNGTLIDCVAWGEDPVGMINGDYFIFNASPDMSDFGACRTAAFAR